MSIGPPASPTDLTYPEWILRQIKHSSGEGKGKGVSKQALAVDGREVLQMDNVTSALVAGWRVEGSVLQQLGLKEKTRAENLFVCQDLGEDSRAYYDLFKHLEGSKLSGFGLVDPDTKKYKWDGNVRFEELVQHLQHYHLTRDKYKACYPPCFTPRLANPARQLETLTSQVKVVVLTAMDRVRIQISTGNPVMADLIKRDNVLFAKEFLFVPSAKGTEPPATTNAPKFKKFLESMGAAEFVVKLHERSADGFYDLTGLDDLLVLSDPTATDLSDFGLHRLRALTQELSKDVDEDSTSTYILDICTSSMGSLTTGTLLDEIEEAMMGNLNKSLGVETHLIYMSQADADKYAFEQRLPSLKWMRLHDAWDKVHLDLKPKFCHYRSVNGPVPHHLKVYTLWRVVGSERQLMWMLMGSHNFSRRAWGGGDTEFSGQNWECSVLISGEAVIGATQQLGASEVLPYETILTPYAHGEAAMGWKSNGEHQGDEDATEENGDESDG